MLKYYANNMYDDVIKYLMMFNGVSSQSISNSCGCCSGDNINNIIINDCDAAGVYKRNSHDKMVNVFSDVNFWLKYPKDVIKKFKQYIDNIIKVGLVIKSTDQSNYKDCTCNNNDSTYLNTLNKLSTTLSYMINDDIVGHKNYIYDSLYDWASHRSVPRYCYGR